MKEYYFKTKPGDVLLKEYHVWETIKAANPDDAEIYFLEILLVSGLNLSHHPNMTMGLLSPIMIGTLFELPFFITKSLITPIYHSLSIALRKIHSLKIIHCDIKPLNIFRDGLGFYHLADYDACIEEYQSNSLSTRVFWPKDLQSFEQKESIVMATKAIRLYNACNNFIVFSREMDDFQRTTNVIR
mmetsp:Transcript_30037/g.42880  ORF Transcript_30037/g.42880 Transcript_30037/m.42880 type:complete len:186 (+) Transcript_30037:488-1045(+)